MTETETAEELNQRCGNGFIKTLGLVFTEVSGTQISAKFKVTEALLTPAGLLHGGVSLAAAESVAGAGSFSKCPAGTMPVGSQVSGNHVKSAKAGQILTVTGTPIHFGKKTHLWNVDIRDESGTLIATARVTNHIVPVF